MKVIALNRKARFEYYIEETFEAGISLIGSEVKSIRNNELNLGDSFVFIRGGEVFIKNLFIKAYSHSNSFSPEPIRDRKLLLNKREILKLTRLVNEQGYTIIPTRMYFKQALVKVEIAIAKGKKLYDKRETIKRREIDREISRKITL